MNKLCGIYVIENLINKKVYVGSSINIIQRLGHHRSSLKHNKHHNILLQNSYNKYSKEYFDYAIIELVIRENLKEREEYWINLLNACSRNCGYNVESEARVPFRKKYKNTLSKVLKGIPKTKEHAKNISKGKTGVRNTEAHKKATSEGLKRYYLNNKQSKQSIELGVLSRRKFNTKNPSGKSKIKGVKYQSHYIGENKWNVSFQINKKVYTFGQYPDKDLAAFVSTEIDEAITHKRWDVTNFISTSQKQRRFLDRWYKYNGR